MKRRPLPTSPRSLPVGPRLLTPISRRHQFYYSGLGTIQKHRVTQTISSLESHRTKEEPAFSSAAGLSRARLHHPHPPSSTLNGTALAETILESSRPQFAIPTIIYGIWCVGTRRSKHPCRRQQVVVVRQVDTQRVALLRAARRL